MKFDLPMPAAFKEAKTCQPGKNIVLEILLCIAVLVISYAVVQTLFGGIFLFAIGVAEGADFSSAVSNGASFETLISDSGKTLAFLFSTLPTLLAVLLLCKLFQKRRPFTLGYVKAHMASEYAVGLLVGLAMMAVAVAVNVIAGGATFGGITSNLPVATVVLIFVGYMFQGLLEETLCRGYLMGSIARGHSLVLAVVLNSALFACLHLGNPGVTPLALVNLFIMGVCFSIYFLKRGSIWACAACHTMWNFAQGNIFGFSVSGTGLTPSIFAIAPVQGADLLNGGAFGMEGGLVTTAVILIAMVIIWKTKTVDVGALQQNRASAGQGNEA